MFGAPLALVIALAALLYLSLRYALFFPRVGGIPILMYHKVHESRFDFLTVTEAMFTDQLSWLKTEGYASISMSEFLDFLERKISRAQLPAKPILITFDDGYEDNVRLAMPILKKYNFTAALFVTSSYIEEAMKNASAGYLQISQLKEWVAAGMGLALHSHAHISYRELSAEAVVADLQLNRKFLEAAGLPFSEAVAYPFGSRPKIKSQLAELKQALQQAKIRAGFRIGNKIHRWSQFLNLDPFEVCRIDVRGDDPFFEFKIKARKGRAKRF